MSVAAASTKPTTQLLASTAAAWYCGNRSSATLSVVHRVAPARRSHQARARSSPQIPTNDPGSRCAPASGVGNVWSGWNMAHGTPRFRSGAKLAGPSAPLVWRAAARSNRASAATTSGTALSGTARITQSLLEASASRVAARASIPATAAAARARLRDETITSKSAASKRASAWPTLPAPTIPTVKPWDTPGHYAAWPSLRARFAPQWRLHVDGHRAH